MKSIKRLLKDKDRAKLIFSSIKEPVFDIVEIKDYYFSEYCLMFWAKDGIVLYLYFTTKPYEIKEIIDESN